MQYLLSIYDSEKAWGSMSEAERNQKMKDYGTFTREIIASGHFKSGDALQSVSTATTVRRREGKRVDSQGPAVESREQFGGYYLVETKDLDEACAIAARIPVSDAGSVEVRPIRAM